MKPLPKTSRIHFIGVAGVGMGAMAGLLVEAGYSVTGSDDAVFPPMSEILAAEGIEVHTPFSPRNLEPPPDLVIVGNGIPKTNVEAEAMRAHGLPYGSFPSVLHDWFLAGRHTIAVAGSHGKTTSTSLLVHTLDSASRDPGFLIGGIPHNIGKGHRIGSGSWFVVEGDECGSAYFDRTPKFLHYDPRTLLCTNLDFDHGEEYGGLADLTARFVELMSCVPSEGLVVLCSESEHLLAASRAAATRSSVVTYGINGDWAVHQVTEVATGFTFIPAFRTKPEHPLTVPLYGRHNLLNALGCYAVLRALGLPHDEIAAGFATFRGVRRRMEVKAQVAGITIMEDFAHHPREVQATLEGVHQRFPGRFIWVLFEPRTFTSCLKTFQKQYALSFQGANRVFIAPPHYRFDADIALDTRSLARALTAGGVPAAAYGSVGAILETLSRELKEGTVVLSLSNGGFEAITARLIAELQGKFPAGGP